MPPHCRIDHGAVAILKTLTCGLGSLPPRRNVRPAVAPDASEPSQASGGGGRRRGGGGWGLCIREGCFPSKSIPKERYYVFRAFEQVLRRLKVVFGTACVQYISIYSIYSHFHALSIPAHAELNDNPSACLQSWKICISCKVRSWNAPTHVSKRCFN